LEKVYVMDEAWDYLIVLDACRYDSMAAVAERYFDGKLDRRVSPGTSTVEWRDASFPGRYEGVVYVSSNPYINGVRPVRGFLGSEHFDRVYDVWRSGWDAVKGTVRPKTVSDAAIAAMTEHPRARIIVHYLQPHAPYLGLETGSLGFPVPDVECERVLTGTAACAEPAFKVFLLKTLTWVCYKMRLLGRNPTWRLRELLAMAPASPMDAVRRACGDSGLRAAYEANLEIVLSSVAHLTRFMAGRIVITSDHGELLGEGGSYSHFPGSRLAQLLEIPWLVVEKKEKEPLDSWRADGAAPVTGGDEDDSEIARRLRALGYID
jgi:hypothetical protein